MSRNEKTLALTERSAWLAFAELYSDQFRFCHDTGTWFEWTGTVWKRDRKGATQNLLAECISTQEQPDPDGKPPASSTARFTKAVDWFCRNDDRFAVTADEWDTDKFLLGTPGGTVDLKTGELRDADPHDLITKQTSVAPWDRADCSRWLAFLDEAMSGDEERIRFLKQWAGYSLTGSTKEQQLLFAWGKGDNGKGVFAHTISGILGDYVVASSMDTFCASRFNGHPTDLAFLRGARLVTASETEEGRAWAEARIKQMTGGDPITARFMARDFFTFLPEFKLMLFGNNMPILRNVDDALRRRINITPFLFKPAVKDLELESKLMEEAPGILRWAIEGCLDWQANGLIRPNEVTKTTSTYFADQDVFGQWIEGHCEIEPAGESWESASTLYESWANFAKLSGEDAGSIKSFAGRLQRYGLTARRSNKTRGYAGIRLMRL